MGRTAYRLPVVALLVVLAASFGVQRAARAGDTGALIGGILAGALVYEMLDDDGYCYGHTHYYTPRYYRPPVYGYYDYGPPVIEYRYYDHRPRSYGYRHDRYYDGPRYSFKAQRAPSHAQRNVGPPPRYGGGGKYAPPRRYGR